MFDRQLRPWFLDRRIAVCAVAGAALLATACGGQGHDMGSMTGHTGAGTDHAGHGMVTSGGALTAEANGYRFSPSTATLPSGPEQRFSFQVLNPVGAPQTRFAVDQTKLLHLYAVRRDLTNFQHVHPELAADGKWSTALNLVNSGPYRIVADFVALDDKGKQVPLALGADVTVPGDYVATTLPPPAGSSAVDGYQVELKGSPNSGMEQNLSFAITKSGSGITNLEPYLDAFGHLTAFKAGTLAYSHLHPAGTAAPGSHGGPKLDFRANLAESGDYRLFFQFQTAGVVHTAPLTIHAN